MTGSMGRVMALLGVAALGCGGGGGAGADAPDYQVDATGCTSGYVWIEDDAGALSYDRWDYGAGTREIGTCPGDGFPQGGLPPSRVWTTGQSWSGSDSSNGYDFEWTARVESMTASLSVTAGAFEGCAHVVKTYSYPHGFAAGQPRVTTSEQWFCPGVGLVKYAFVNDNDDSSVWNHWGWLVDYELAGASATDYFPLAVGDWWTYIENKDTSETATWTVNGLAP